MDPLAQASIPHSICADPQLLKGDIKNQTTYRSQDQCNGFYRKRIKKIRINNTLVARVVEPASVDYPLNDGMLIETRLRLKVLQIDKFESYFKKKKGHMYLEKIAGMM